MKKLALWSVAFTLAAGLSAARADDRTDILKESGTLDADAPLDKKSNTHHTAYKVKLTAGQFIHVELKSSAFKPYLRIMDPADKVVAENTKSGAISGAMRVEKDGAYRFIVAGATKEKTGDFVLTVSKASLKDRSDLLRSKVPTLYKMPAAVQDEFLLDLKEMLTEKGDNIDAGDLDLSLKACRNFEYRKDVAAVYDGVIDVLNKGPKSAVPAVNVMKGVVRRTPGKEISALTGTTVKGDEFNWKEYRGKVVLIDFWATWCGPCRAELPNVLRLYDKYHAQGFEVVGISTDRDRGALDKFFEKQKLPWVCLHEGDGARPMARMYGLQYIPLAILVDREGKVLSMHARGAELARLLEKHVGDK